MTRDAPTPSGIVLPRLPYSPVILSGDHVFTAGQVAHGRGRERCRGGIAEQTTQVLGNLRLCLAAAGCDLDDVAEGQRVPRRHRRLRGVQRGLPRGVLRAVSRADDRAGGATSRPARRGRGGRATSRPGDAPRHPGRRSSTSTGSSGISSAGRLTATGSGSRTAHTSRRTARSRSRSDSSRSAPAGVTCQKLGEAEVMADAGMHGHPRAVQHRRRRRSSNVCGALAAAGERHRRARTTRRCSPGSGPLRCEGRAQLRRPRRL